MRAWGNYFLLPSNIDDAIEKTPWAKWKGIEVMMSSTHDPYLPNLTNITHKILEKGLPEGVKFCIQTRSPLIERDFPLLIKYKNQVRIQGIYSHNEGTVNDTDKTLGSTSKSKVRYNKKGKRIGF